MIEKLFRKKKSHNHNWRFMRTELLDAGEISWFHCTICLEYAKVVYTDKIGAVEIFYYGKKAPVHLAGIPDKKK